MFWIVLIIFMIGSSLSSKNVDNFNYQTKPSVLIIGSSIPALTAALQLTDYNISVTLLYSTNEIDNQISPTTTLIKNEIYRLPKTHFAIFERSVLAKNLFSRFGNKFTVQNEINLLLDENYMLSISSNEFIIDLFYKSLNAGCISWTEFFSIHSKIKEIRNYNPTNDKLKYSNITLSQFGKLKKMSSKFMSCFFKAALIDLDSQVETINAADAFSRMQFYYLRTNNGLRSYHVVNPYNSNNNSKLLVDQIVKQLKIKNTTFKSNYTLEAFYVDPSTGRILGDINNKNILYDYIILGDSLEQSRRILSITKSYNSGNPIIYYPLKQVLDSMNQYSNASNNLSIKFWLSKPIDADRKPILEITNSPYPCSIQSIKRIDHLSGMEDKGNLIELIVTGCSSNSKELWQKVINELTNIYPEIESVNRFRCDPIDFGVSMDTKYGNNRLSMSSAIKYGMSNLFLAGDWVDLADSIESDLEKSFSIGIQVASEVIKRVYLDRIKNK